MKKFISNQLDELLKNGSDITDLKMFLNEINKTMKEVENNSPTQFIKFFSKDIIEKTNEFMSEKNDSHETLVDALSTCIYLPDKNGEYKIKFIGGKTSDGIDVNEDTLFDVASITKMYTLLLIFKLEELGYINFEQKISSLDNRFKDLKDFTIKDIMLLHGVLYTNGMIKEAENIDKANQILETVHLKSSDRTRNTYTDLGIIALSKAIEKVMSERLGKQISFSEIMEEYLFKPFGLNNTKFNPEKHNLAGNGNKLGLVHDPKTRILGGAVGSAGIFTNSDDLAKLASEMYLIKYFNYDQMKNLVSPENLRKMGTITFPDSPQNNRGLFGLYQKNQDRENKWLHPLVYGDYSFTAQGFTGSVASFDPTNKIHNNFLIGTIKENEAKKPDGFMEAFHKYQRYIVAKTLSLLIAKRYYNLQLEDSSVEQTFKALR